MGVDPDKRFTSRRYEKPACHTRRSKFHDAMLEGTWMKRQDPRLRDKGRWGEEEKLWAIGGMEICLGFEGKGRLTYGSAC